MTVAAATTRVINPSIGSNSAPTPPAQSTKKPEEKQNKENVKKEEKHDIDASNGQHKKADKSKEGGFEKTVNSDKNQVINILDKQSNTQPIT